MSKTKEKELLLYYFPTSYSSQKVLFALYEKDVKFKPKIVSLFSGQHNEPWYLKLNPDGCHIPVLRYGDTVIADPVQIIDFISRETESAGGHPIVPSKDCELGKNVAALRQKLDNISVDIVTYGIIYHPQLSASPCLIPGAVQRSMKENFKERLPLLTQLATKHPELRDTYLTKSQITAHKFDIITDEIQVNTHLTDMAPLFQSIEEQLQKIKDVGSDISDELWLFGPMFTAADISLTILLDRLTLLGLNERFFPSDKCPCICQYFENVRKRPAYKMIQKEVSNLRLTLLWENLKTACPFILASVGVACVVGGAYLAYKKANSD